MSITNHYSILGVSEDASVDDVKKAYRKLASKNHPDKGGNTERFQEIQQAYDVLSEPNKRAEYDRIRKFGSANTFGRFNQPGGFNFHFGDFDINGMDDLFANIHVNRHRPESHQRKNKDLKITIPVSLEDSLKAHNKVVEVKTTTPGSNSKPTVIEINVPKGVNNNTTVRYRGLGDDLFAEVPRGDLIVSFKLIEHPVYSIINDIDLIRTITLSIVESMTGKDINITTLDGSEIMIHIKPGTQPGTKLRIKGHGLYKENANDRGNLLVQVDICVPSVKIEELESMVTEDLLKLLNQNYTKWTK